MIKNISLTIIFIFLFGFAPGQTQKIIGTYYHQNTFGTSKLIIKSNGKIIERAHNLETGNKGKTKGSWTIKQDTLFIVIQDFNSITKYIVTDTCLILTSTKSCIYSRIRKH